MLAMARYSGVWDASVRPVGALRPAPRADIERQDIALDDGDIIKTGEGFCQRGKQRLIQLYGYHAPGMQRKDARQASQSGANFQDSVTGGWLACPDHATQGALIDEEVLPQAFLWAQTVAFKQQWNVERL